MTGDFQRIERKQFSHQWISQELNERGVDVLHQIPHYDAVFDRNKLNVRKTFAPNIWKTIQFIFNNLEYDGGSFSSPWTPSSLDTLTGPSKAHGRPHYLVGEGEDQVYSFNSSIKQMNEIFNDVLPMNSAYSSIFQSLAKNNESLFLETVQGSSLHQDIIKKQKEFAEEPIAFQKSPKGKLLQEKLDSFSDFLKDFNLDSPLTFSARQFKMPCDYIFYKGSVIQPFRVLDVPSIKKLQSIQKEDPVPNQFFPSDHFFLVADFKM